MSRKLLVTALATIITLAGCSETRDAPTAATPHAATVSTANLQDVRAVNVDRPPEPRPWDTSYVALEAAIAAETGHAIVAFKAPASARAISTGRREAIPAATIAAGLDLLVLLGVTVVEYYSFMGAAHVQLPPGIATLLRDNPLIDYIEPRQWWTVQGSGIPLSVFVSADYSAQIIPWGVELVRAPEAWTVCDWSWYKGSDYRYGS